MAGREPSCARALLGDDDGAILAIGAFVAPLLVGAIYYFVSCSTVIMQREGLQQAADAAALSPSVASARGMNAIAVMNVLMMCIMSIVIPVRALLPAYKAVAAMPCYFDACWCSVVADAKRASRELELRKRTVERRARDLLTALSDAQDALATQVPQAGRRAAANSAQRTRTYLETTTPEVYSSSLAQDSCRKGLPVEDDSFTNVCKRTQPYVYEIAVRVAGPETLDTLQACRSGPFALALAAPDLANPGGARMCEEARNAPCSGSGPHPKKVVEGGKNGSDHMQWWVSLQGREFDSSRSGVEVAGTTKGAGPDRALDIGFAQSELYFDCRGAWGSSDCNQEEGAMWNTRWTARLRRVHSPSLVFHGSDEVRSKLTEPSRWNGVRSKLAAVRRDFVTGAGATTDVAELARSSSEGPLQ